MTTERTSRLRTKRYRTPEESIPFVFEQYLKHELETATPGVIVAYDVASRRASVQVALNTVYHDGHSTRGPIINDVPVIFPCFSGFMIHGPLQPDEPVQLVVNKRGIRYFKQFFRIADYDRSGLFDLPDAVAFVGYGPSGPWTPATTTGLSIQSIDGTTSIQLEQDGITIDSDGPVTINTTSLTISAAAVSLSSAARQALRTALGVR